jgi:hypothetical protein
LFIVFPEWHTSAGSARFRTDGSYWLLGNRNVYEQHTAQQDRRFFGGLEGEMAPISPEKLSVFRM